MYFYLFIKKKTILIFKNLQEKNVNIKDLLKERAIELLENLANYSINFNSRDVLFCKLCEKVIEDSISLILWNSDREHYVSFHFPCALKEGTTDLFYELMSTFDYIYPIEPIYQKKRRKRYKKR